MSFLWLWYPMNNGVVFTCWRSWVCGGFGYPTAEKLRVSCWPSGVWWGWRYPTANNGLFSPAAHYESAVASGISLNNGVVFTSWTSWVCCGFRYVSANMGFYLLRIGGRWGRRIWSVNNGIVFTGCTLCVAVASGIRLNNVVVFNSCTLWVCCDSGIRLRTAVVFNCCTSGVWWGLGIWLRTRGCSQLLRIRNPLRLKTTTANRDCTAYVGHHQNYRLPDVAQNGWFIHTGSYEKLVTGITGRGCSAYYHFR